MFGIQKDQLVINLEKLHSQRCAYQSGPEGSCDCKFGGKDQEPRNLSETFPGCPELRQVTRILESMDDTAFRMWCMVADILI